MQALPPISTVLLPSAARTTAQSVELERGYSSIQVIIDVTLDPGTASITPAIEGWDEASGKWIALLTGTAIAATGQVILTVGDWIATAANVSRSMKAPSKCRFTMAVADAQSMTYSVGAWLHK
jgi:hypothetical protein